MRTVPMLTSRLNRAAQWLPSAICGALPTCMEMLSSVASVDDRMSSQELDVFLRALGQRLAASQAIPAGDTRRRLEAGVSILNHLGGLVELEETDTAYSICGYSCPLMLVMQHPEACRITQALLTEIAGVPVEEQCERSESLACWFEVSKPEQAEHHAAGHN